MASPAPLFVPLGNVRLTAIAQFVLRRAGAATVSLHPASELPPPRRRAPLAAPTPLPEP